MKRQGLYLFAALFGLCSCAVDPLPEDQPSGEEFREVSVMADAMTRTVMKDDAVVWEDGDKIALIFTHRNRTKKMVFILVDRINYKKHIIQTL